MEQNRYNIENGNIDISHGHPGAMVLASLISSYPDQDFSEGVQVLVDDPRVLLPNDLREKLRQISRDENLLNELRSEYIAVFDHAKTLNPLYETEFGRERAMFKANELSDVAGFYRAFGFELDQLGGTREMVDHVSVELEFYSLLMMKHLYLQEIGDLNGCEIVFDGMKKFMKDHLGRFVGAIAERPGVVESESYRQIFDWIGEVVSQECQRIGVTPERATWFASQVEGEKMCCGDTVPLNK